ncbi:MAG: adenine deaminase [Anaerolineae bacterium]|nr:adenine deaminase [Phycisphaerae bacterium]
MSLDDLLSIARGDAPADLVLQHGRIVNVFSGEIESADIAIAGGLIAGIGAGYEGRRRIDLRGAFVAPGLIDAHVHIESSLCIPSHFEQAVVPRGVTTVVADPHEIANVCDVDGVRFMAEASQALQLRVVLMAPSCVPATKMSNTGGELSALDLQSLFNDKLVHGLAEMMNFPATIGCDAGIISKVRFFSDLKRPVDGHAPGVTGRDLNAYIAMGIGSDHECVTIEEAREKLARGMYVLIREATNARNLDALLPLITPQNSRRICFCTDDRTPPDLLEHGSVDMMLRRVIAGGVDPIDAVRICTLNPCEWFGLNDRGAIAPGRFADVFVFDDLRAPVAKQVFIGGMEYRDSDNPSREIPSSVLQTCRIDEGRIDFAIAQRGSRVRAIGSMPDQLITEHRVLDATIRDGHAVADPSRDLLKMAVIERHRGTGNVGLGFIQGIGLKRGAIAGTVAHDHHNLVIIGCDDVSMMTAARAVAKMNGGLVVTNNESIVASLPLPVAGLMSDRPIAEVRDAYVKLLAAARELGSSLHDPFMAMSFMALEVIPKLKLTDQGLVDVERFEIVDLFA